ncbi:S1/P1 nuclease [Chryseolinea lacunae]|uniref:S1/P1 nuclease n=1 Tax=Chryseolinea lacunae TaxID=2801331 RepID=A0ABS1KLU7_9BACT|nr:S1/P1 nuclease [Chryseolinea lacunae]MBL0740299.1 S1/P1 nuclease [Chryseolinea lacunae]
MKKVILTLSFFAIALSAWAWGATGHRAIGFVADKYLSKKAQKELQRILAGQSTAMASTWMDEIRSDSTYDYAGDWHWVTIQDGQTYEQSEKNPHGDLIQTIERLITELKSKKLNAKDEAEHLKMLIHLVGDVHQPLHVGQGTDAGGNKVKVTWFRGDSNLHTVWDSEMIDDTHLSYTELGESLEKPDAVKIAAWQKKSVRDWAYESMTYRPQVYAIGNGKLSYKYAYLNMPVVRQRLVQAGVRLAGILNEIYK